MTCFFIGSTIAVVGVHFPLIKSPELTASPCRKYAVEGYVTTIADLTGIVFTEV